jgi:hypothetical protein
MTTEDEIRRALHPEAHEPMRYEPRIPLGCDQQGRYPQAAEPCVDLDELGVKLPPQEPWWPYILGAVVGLLALVLVFAPLGV